MLKLSDSQKFKAEYKQYQIAIERMTQPEAKNKGQILLNKLRSECLLIDQAHSYDNNINIDPRLVRENIDQLVEIRRQLNQLIKDSKGL